MKAISRREHTAIISALQQLRELQVQGVLPADGFSLPIQTLSKRFSHYEDLLTQLAEAIAEYEAVYREVRINVVAPAMRRVRRERGGQLEAMNTM